MNKMNLGTCEIRVKSPYFVAFFLIALATVALFLTTGEDGGVVLEEESNISEQEPVLDNIVLDLQKPEQVATTNDSVSSALRCDLFSGRWVFDNTSYPLYDEKECSFMLEDYACEKNGRKEFKYQNWKWQPHHCDLPRFNGSVFLEEIRGKRLVFVGDSLNKNQWTSMLCLIESSLDRSSSKPVVLNDNLFVFHATDYNATIEFYWSPLLVESNCDDPVNHRVGDRIFRITSIEKHAIHWTDADILIFDSFMWWLDPTMTILWGSFGSSDAIYKRVEMKLRRYEMALNTWSDWLEININRNKTKLFFMSLSPYHFEGASWKVEETCNKQTEPIQDEGYWGVSTNRDMMHIAESAIHRLNERGVNIDYLNITHLSDYRRDAHPSIYWKFGHLHPPPSIQLLDPRKYSDCVHWCLPGVPDVWNQILYSYIVKKWTNS